MPIDFSHFDKQDPTVAQIQMSDYQQLGYIGVGNAAADTYALQAAQSMAIVLAHTSGRPVKIVIPQGVYTVNISNLFGGFGGGVQRGITYEGNGKDNTIFRLATGGTPMWFYDNGATDKSIFPRWRNIGFQGDGTANSNGFRFTSHGNEQGPQFYDCEFGGDAVNYFGGTLFDWEGSVGDDSLKLIGCRAAFIHGDMFLWNNPQAVTIELFGTNLELGYGNIFHVGSGGGGDLHVYGGDCLMDGATASAPMTYYLQVDESNNVGKNNNGFHFHGTKFEIRSPTVGLVNAPCASNLGSMDITFEDCLFAVVNGNGLNGASIGTARVAVSIGNRRQVLFSHCSIPAEWTYTINAQTSGAPANGTAGHIGFDACGFVPATGSLTDDVSSRFTFTNAWGTAHAAHCYFSGNPSQHYALDFDLNSTNAVFGDVGPRRKLAQMFPIQQTWPGNTGAAEKTVVLPKGCKITGVYLLKPAHGSNGGSQVLSMGSSDKTITYGTVTAAQDTQMTFSTSLAPFQDTAADGSDPNQRTVRLWSTGSGLDSQANIGGYAYVEYI